MKFAFAVVALLTTAATKVSAGTFASPTEGQVLSASEPFNFTWISGKYFKESSISVSVVLSSDFATLSSGKELVNGLESTTAGISTYYASLTPSFFYGSPQSGNHQIVVLERYNAYGGGLAVDATSVQNVTFA